MQDDTPQFVIRRDLSGGVNTRQHEQVIGDTESTVLSNIILDTVGQRSLRAGSSLLENLGTSAGTGLFGFEPEGGTNSLLASYGVNVSYATAFAASGFVTASTAFTANLPTIFVKAIESDEGDVVIISNGTDNVYRMNQSYSMQDLGDTNGSPPKTPVYEWYRNRLWALDGNKLYYSGAIPSDYSASATGGFVRNTNYYNIPVGEARRIVGLRDTGMLIAGSEQIWGLNPAITPAPSTDKPELILDMGVRASNTMQMVADDVWFLAPDGVSGVFRTQQDKVQLGQSKPLTWKLKTEFDSINWGKITKAEGIYFDGKYFISLPTGTSTYNNEIWVAYPDIRDNFGLPSWVVFTGLAIAKFAKISVSGEERLYGIDASNGKVYRLFSGTSDNGTAITFLEEGRAEDFGQPLKYKWGGEFKLKVKGGTGTIIASANPDNTGYTQLGSITLSESGLDFPLTFPLDFRGDNEAVEQFHLDSLGKFKRIKFKIYANTLNQSITILESIATTFSEEYLNED